MTKEDFAMRCVRCENGEAAVLRYRIVEEEIDGITRYGAEIVMRRGGRTERAAVRDVTASRAGMRDFLQRLADHTVTPCTLREIVEDALNNS